jgi:rhodanese-related sulfurtransferase
MDTINVSELKELLKKGQAISIIDVRREMDYESDKQMIPGAVWRDPEKTGEWCKDLPKDKDIVIYCVRGGSVSKSVAEQMTRFQLPVRYIEGGIAAWNADKGDA